MLGNNNDIAATVAVRGLPQSMIWPQIATTRKPMILQIPDIWALLKNIAENTLALVIAQPTRICQKREMARLEVRNN